MRATLAQCAAALLGADAVRTDPLQGGSLSQIVRVRLSDGRDVVVKAGTRARREASMLEAIARAGVPTPAVLAVDAAILVLAHLQAGEDLSTAWPSLGAALSRLHAVEGSAYGWHDDDAFGTLSIVNGWHADWPEFWASNRLRVHGPHLPSDMARRVERLAADLPNRLPARPRAALLHGDLWGGNVLVSGGRVTGLIDPACYHGHAEVDLAMLSMFDSPGASFREAYGPPEPGFRDRSPIYRLWPALVHFRLFGTSYRAMAETCLAQAGV